MEENKEEEALVTVSAMKKFIDTFKENVYNWNDPHNNNNNDNINSIDKNQDNVEKIVFATTKDILDLFNGDKN